MEIITVENKEHEKFLRQKTAAFDFAQFSRAQISALIKNMRMAMKRVRGLGLSANQVHINARMFIAEVDRKFYAVFNPEIVKSSLSGSEMEEGCLSIPRTYGAVLRSDKVELRGFDRNGKQLKIKAWGLLARVFQHEVDHLNGILFTDKAEKIYRVPVGERLKTKTFEENL